MKSKQFYTMKELPDSERPYEKCMRYGAGILSDAELLAVIIRSGIPGNRSTELAVHVLEHTAEKSIHGLTQLSVEQLMEIKGIGKVKAIQILCLAEAAKRMSGSIHTDSLLLCDSPERIADYFMPKMRFLEREEVHLLILNGRNFLQKEITISMGTFNASVAAPREIFYYALKHKAVNIILLHNHPSGDPTPSREDILLTKRLLETGRLVGVPLLDHIVIGDNRYVSLKQSGYFI